MPARKLKNASVPVAVRLRELSADLIKVMSEMGNSLNSKDAHRLRTSIRRIEVVLEPAENSSKVKKLQRRLAKLRRAAGHVRDIDVHTDLLLGLDAGDYAADCSNLKNDLLRVRDKFEKKAVKQANKELDSGLDDRLKSAATLLEQGVSPERVPIAKQVQHIREQYLEFTSEVPLDGDPLHDLRKAAKRLRYRLESLPGRESRRLERDLKVIQDLIGDWHDWATLTEEAENRLQPRSIAFVAFLRSRSIAKRHEARRGILAMRQKLTKGHIGKKPPVRDAGIQPQSQRQAAG